MHRKILGSYSKTLVMVTALRRVHMESRVVGRKFPFLLTI